MPWFFTETNRYEQTEGYLYDVINSGWLTVETPTVTMSYLWWKPTSKTYTPGLYWWEEMPELSEENVEDVPDLTFFKLTKNGDESDFYYLVLPKMETNPFKSFPANTGTYVYTDPNTNPSTNFEKVLTKILQPSFTTDEIDPTPQPDELTIIDLLPARTSDKPIIPDPCIEGVSNTHADCIPRDHPSVPEYSSILTFVFLGTAFCCGLFRRRKR